MSNDSWVELDNIEKGVDALVERARRLREPRPARGRELSSILVQEVGNFSPFVVTQQESTFYNGDERDLVIEKLTAIVYNIDPATGAVRRRMTPYGGAWCNAGLGALGAGGAFVDSRGRLFDFAWNMSFGDTQATYARARMLSSFVLGDIQRKRYLEFARPLILRKSASLTFTVQPTCFHNAVQGTDQFLVSFVGLGYRRQPERRDGADGGAP